MKKEISIRRASDVDAKAIFNFICVLEQTAFNYDDFLELYTINIADADWIYLVAVDENKDSILGYISCHAQLLLHHMGKVFEIQEMFIQENYRGKGIGKLLLVTLEEYLEQHQYISLEVTTNKIREDAIRFYTGCGFKQTHLKFTKTKK